MHHLSVEVEKQLLNSNLDPQKYNKDNTFKSDLHIWES